MITGFARTALVLAVLLSLAPKVAQATVYHPAPNPIISTSPGGTFAWSITPGDPVGTWYSDKSNSDIGNQSPGNVEIKLESPTWLGAPLTFVSGGSCAIATNCTTGPYKSGTWTYAGTPASVFGIHLGKKFIAVLFSSPVDSFFITGLPNGVSNIYAFNLTATPLPGALWLMLSAMAGWLGLTRWVRSGRPLSTS